VNVNCENDRKNENVNCENDRKNENENVNEL